MANHLPSFLMRNCMLYVDRVNKIGQIGDITPPVPKKKMEEMRNAGMIKPRDIDLGYEKLEFSFKMPGLDPQIIKLFGLKPGVETLFMITGALVDEDGTEHSAVMTVRGNINSSHHGSWKPGDQAENNYQCSVNYYKLEIDGENVLEVDDFDVVSGGVSQYAGIRNSLLLA
ncbi:phage major tail tube protein [Rhizobium tumorigenes]|uniref:phage major tail tube protein n=1 Tax=Rhizobium tumorigenes TaxID=2041385 RepID=UPI00241F697B|nr:phage major tail tube protein [Rhizobium tumorigenes]WFS02765.1 phage major tail tube protein [Rhizobium tumorigenes]